MITHWPDQDLNLNRPTPTPTPVKLARRAGTWVRLGAVTSGLLLLTACSSSGGSHAMFPAASVPNSTTAGVTSPSEQPSTTSSQGPVTTSPSAVSSDVATPRSSFIAVCTIINNFSLNLDFFDATTGALIKHEGNLTFASPSFTATGAGSEHCDGLSFNNKLTQVAGIDQNGKVPASMELATGHVYDQVAVTGGGGFDATPTRDFVAVAYNPTGSDDVWTVEQLSTTRFTLSGPGFEHTYSGIDDEYGSGGDPQFFWPKHGSAPYVAISNALLEPNGKHINQYPGGQIPAGAVTRVLSDSKLPHTNYSLGDILFSDDHTSTAFVAETDGAAPVLRLYTVGANGGEPAQLGPDLSLPLPQFNEGADQPQVVRYVMG